MRSDEFEEILTNFVLNHKENMYRLAYSYVKNVQDALDVVQDSIQKALTKRKTLQDEKAIKGWFYRIIVNTALDLLRKQKRLQLVDDSILDFYGAISEDIYQDVDIERALEQLPVQYREVIILRFFEDLKIEEVAHVLGLSMSTVKTRLYRALYLLRIDLEKEKLTNE